MPKSNIKFIPIQNKSVIVHVCFVLFIVCLYIWVCECLLPNNNHQTKHKNNTTSKQHNYVRGPLRECSSIRPGASGLPYYCAPLVRVSDVTDSLVVWRHNKTKTKTKSQTVWRDNTISDKTVQNGDKCSSAPEWNMGRNGIGNLVQWGESVECEVG